MTVLSVTPASAEPGPGYLVIEGSDTSYNKDYVGAPPEKVYENRPPIMAARRIGSGAVVAAGFARTTNGGIAYPTQRWVAGELDVLFDKAFQWMVSGAENVLWYGHYEEGATTYNRLVYNYADRASWLIDSLRAKGYTVDNTVGTADPITPSLLAPYDILVIPQFQVGPTGGNPDLLPDEVVATIENFVEGGGGLLIMESGDYDSFNYYRVQNKILEALNFGLYFQHDTVFDPTSSDDRYVTAIVTDNEFGADYIAATGKNTIRLYKTASMLIPGPGVTVRLVATHRFGAPGSTLNFTISATNLDLTPDNYSLTVNDTAGWGLFLSDNFLDVPGSATVEVMLSVTIPSGANIGAEDNVTITATSLVKEGVSDTKSIVLRAENQIPPAYFEVIASVDGIADGDSIFVTIENIVVELDPSGEVFEDTAETVRFGGGIDAPESDEEGGPESTQFVRNLIPPGTTVYLDLDNLAVGGQTGRPYRGNFERLIAIIYVVIEGRWINVNAELLRWGMEAYPNNYWDEYTGIVSEHSLYEWPPYDDSYPYVSGFLVPFGPIYIDGDDNFTSVNGVVAGSGTPEDPYAIENWEIYAWNANGIEVRNTTAYFVIRGCYVYGGRDNGFDGIRFDNVTNGRIDTVRSENNYHGVNYLSSINNLIVNSSFKNNTYGIRLVESDNNRIYHNNLMNNANQAHDNGANYWDDGYPSGGNYWSDYPGADNYWGEDQNIPGSDGIGDTPYNIPSGANQDRYPFIITPVSRKVEVLISPSYQSVPPGATLAYTVTIINTGNIVDNYVLGVSDSASWGPSISSGSLMVLPGASDNITLSITVPENAEPGTEDNITITATSQTDNTVSDSDLCTAHALSPIAEFGLTTLYGVSLDLNIYLGEGSRLVVKFYTWAGPFQAENVVWSGVTPAHVVLLMNVSHPENTAVQNAMLVSTDDMGNVISTIASFTVTRDDLFMRIMAIKGEWPLPGADQDALFQEIMDIKGVWPIAPS
jgi:hypothetical protein